MVLEKIRDLSAEQFSVPKEEITEETTFKELEADSLDLVELIMAIEEEFDLQVADEDVEGIATVGDVVEYVKARI